MVSAEITLQASSSMLVPQGQKASDYDNSDPVPPRQNVVTSAKKTDSSHQGLEFLFSPLLEEYYNPTHDQAEEKQHDTQHRLHLLVEASSLSNFRCPRSTQVFSNLSEDVKRHFDWSFKEEVHVAQPEGFFHCSRISQIKVYLLGKLCWINASLQEPVDETIKIMMSKGFLKAWMSNETKRHCSLQQRQSMWRYLQVVPVENGIIELYFVRTEYQLADMFTKALPEDRFKYLVRRIGMRCLTPAELEVLTNETA
ncbi:hypothetical protein Tco_1033632 [Tanacetum coccineum]